MAGEPLPPFKGHGHTCSSSLPPFTASFASCPGSLERDPRFVYCAFAICTMIDDWSGIDVNRALDYLDSCRSYDGAFAQGARQESHGE